MNTGRKRRPRADRTHVIYQLRINGQRYIGITFLRKQSLKKTMRTRIKQHWYNANVLQYGWHLSNAIRELDCIEDIEYEVLAKVKGKVEAHNVERKYIRIRRPQLNTDIRIARKR